MGGHRPRGVPGGLAAARADGRDRRGGAQRGRLAGARGTVLTGELLVRVAGPGDAGTIAALRALWTGAAAAAEPGFEARMAAWLQTDGERRTTWLAEVERAPAGMASLFEYRRMPRPRRPDSRWGYLGNMFVREELRNRGIGTALLRAVIAAADERGYARLVLSPSERAVGFYRRAGFVVPDEEAGGDRLLVRPAGG